MRWITLFALAAVGAVFSYGADPVADATAPATSSAANTDAGTAVANPTEEEPQLEGVVVERKSGGFMTLTMDGKKLVLRFFDAKKKPVAADVRGGFVRFLFGNRSPERRPLVPTGDGMGLTHGEPLRTPHIFSAHITLRHGEGEDEDDIASEDYIVSYP